MPFSVLMSLYIKERPAFLRQSLDSIFNQTLQPEEVVLVEDGPLTHELYDVIDEYKDKYPQIKVVPLLDNVGLGNALNIGLKECSYEFVARMDTDDVSKRDRFATQVEFMQNHPEISVCSAWIEEFYESIDNVVTIKKLPIEHEEIYAYAKKRCPINHPVVIFRKSDVMASGGYGPFPEDYYLWGRMLKQNYRFHNINQSLLFFRSSNDVYKRRGGWRYFQAISSLQKYFFKIGLLTYREYLYNMLIRSVVSLMPNCFRKMIYTHLLRGKNSTDS